MDFFEQMEARIPHGEVRTRFAPSPTGYMHVGNLRTALYTWLIARRHHGKFILRIEDTDQGRLVEGAVDVIYKTMAECGLTHDEGPDVGGPVGPYVQSERRDLFGKYAKLLCEKGGAYYCFCQKGDEEDAGSETGEIKKHVCACRDLPLDEAKKRVEAGEPFVIRQRIPHEGTTTFHDVQLCKRRRRPSDGHYARRTRQRISVLRTEIQSAVRSLWLGDPDICPLLPCHARRAAQDVQAPRRPKL